MPTRRSTLEFLGAAVGAAAITSTGLGQLESGGGDESTPTPAPETATADGAAAPAGSPTAAPATATATPDANATATATPEPTPTATPSQTPTATPEPTPTPTPTPTPEPIEAVAVTNVEAEYNEDDGTIWLAVTVANDNAYAVMVDVDPAFVDAGGELLLILETLETKAPIPAGRSFTYDLTYDEDTSTADVADVAEVVVHDLDAHRVE